MVSLRHWALLGVLPAVVSAQSANDSLESARVQRFIKDYQARSTPFLKAGNHLGVLSLLEELQAASQGSPSVRGTARQLVATFGSFIGEDAGIATALSRRTDVKLPFDSSGALPYEARDAADVVVERA